MDKGSWSEAKGVQCEVCHGPAEQWLEPHTKPKEFKWDHAASVKAGMIDLWDLKTAATTCVKCHLAIDNELIAAEHPKLNFELVDYLDRMPPHWESKGHPYMDPATRHKAWAVGQVAALRAATENAIKQKGDSVVSVKAHQAVLGLLADVSGDPSEDLIKKIDALDVAAPGPDFLKKLAAVEPADFETARQVALAFNAIGPNADVTKLCAHIGREGRKAFDPAKFKADLDAVRKNIK
jgi:hypothetical protein